MIAIQTRTIRRYFVSYEQTDSGTRTLRFVSYNSIYIIYTYDRWRIGSRTSDENIIETNTNERNVLQKSEKRVFC